MFEEHWKNVLLMLGALLAITLISGLAKYLGVPF
jgi:hypothetical protein